MWVHGDRAWSRVTDDEQDTAETPRRARWVRISERDDLVDAARRWGAPDDVVAALAASGATWGHRAHVEHLPGDALLVAAPTLAYAPDTRDVTSGRLACLVVDGLVLTVENEGGAVLDTVETRLCSPGPVPGEGARQVLAATLGTLVATAGEVEAALGEAVADTEAVVFSTAASEPIARVYRLKREIAEARRALVPLSSELPELVSATEDAHPDAPVDRWLRRLETAVERIDRRLDAHDALLGDLLAVHLSQVSVRQNEDQRKISAWAAIGALPTLVASVYGMNFQHMPELAWTYGYGLVLAVLVTACTVLYRRFKRSGWL